MPIQCKDEFILKVFQLLNEADAESYFYWRTDDIYYPLTLFVNSNDIFWWGCADCEELTPENLPVLEQSLKDAKEASGEKYPPDWSIELFVCRVNKMRPQGAAYPYDKTAWPLLDACGPEREVGIGNPYTPEGYWQYRQAKVAKNEES